MSITPPSPPTSLFPSAPFQARWPFLQHNSSPPSTLPKAAFTSPFPSLWSDVHCRKPLDLLPMLFSSAGGCLCCKDTLRAHFNTVDTTTTLSLSAKPPPSLSWCLEQLFPMGRTQHFPFLKYVWFHPPILWTFKWVQKIQLKFSTSTSGRGMKATALPIANGSHTGSPSPHPHSTPSLCVVLM